ncbi:uncharacterized protein FOMMEDRAFT_166463 [Fomitiporia mediterranea MF3/22]|uniref:uncharacterized protein n=1 Tax=Fomitiporia mediterranea (strain MF3/22) TaxID=694068 RepID=UPI0004409827|nr:uncharacterized protein FOMMEDRAFT_166463 [Fomitiporia mediterranea MF3/22]EJD06214.1 hypothetical protein FOMMEDRAFT_166463 [Fomitiporia mediterranea MF3/22]
MVLQSVSMSLQHYIEDLIKLSGEDIDFYVASSLPLDSDVANMSLGETVGPYSINAPHAGHVEALPGGLAPRKDRFTTAGNHASWGVPGCTAVSDCHESGTSSSTKNEKPCAACQMRKKKCEKDETELKCRYCRKKDVECLPHIPARLIKDVYGIDVLEKSTPRADKDGFVHEYVGKIAKASL